MKTNNLLDDTTLVARISNGDERAFGLVYDHYFPKIRAFSRRILHDDEQALEVAQDVLLAFWKKGSRLRQIRNPEAFLSTLCKRRAIDALRKKMAIRAAEQAAREAWNENSEETEERVAGNELRQLLDDGLSLLPPQQQKAYQLCHQEGMKYEEAARMMDISPGTVHGHMKRALRFMRGYLNERLGMILILISVI